VPMFPDESAGSGYRDMFRPAYDLEQGGQVPGGQVPGGQVPGHQEV